jgi:SAM-dependent methyltransferase
VDPRADDELVPPELFDEDVYDYFYGAALERGSDAQAALIAELGGLRAGTAVLDVPCGDGRIAVRLAQRGCRVVAVDRSARFIARARARAGGERVRFDVGDMRALRHDAEFECVVNWFTSFGYFDAPTNRALLRAFRRALRPAGRLVLELRNPATLRRAVAAGDGSAAFVVDRGLDLLVDRARLDGDRTHVERFVVRDGRVRKIEFSLETFDSDALGAALREAGFSAVELFDGDGEPFTAQSTRLVAVAHAPTPASPAGP